jgi:hypothetical protein
MAAGRATQEFLQLCVRPPLHTAQAITDLILRTVLLSLTIPGNCNLQFIQYVVQEYSKNSWSKNKAQFL